MLQIGGNMNFLHIENNQKSRLYVNIARTIMYFTFIFKIWLLAEMQANAYSSIIGGEVMSRVVLYLGNSLVAFLLAVLAVSLSYTIFSRSKYSPVDANCYCRVNKPTYNVMAYTAISICNFLCGCLNFVAYSYAVSIVFVTLVIPIIMSVIAIAILIAMMYSECQKGELKQLLTSMTLASIIYVLLLR